MRRPSATNWDGKGDCGFARLERDGRPVGAPVAGNEEICVERDAREGGKPFTGALAHPPSNTGAIPEHRHSRQIAEAGRPIPQFYADAVVVAYRRPAGDVPIESLHPKVTASAGALDMAILSDGDPEKTTKLPIPAAGESAWIQYEIRRAPDDALHDHRDERP